MLSVGGHFCQALGLLLALAPSVLRSWHRFPHRLKQKAAGVHARPALARFDDYLLQRERFWLSERHERSGVAMPIFRSNVGAVLVLCSSILSSSAYGLTS